MKDPSFQAALATALQKRMRAKGMTAAELGRLSGLTHDAISHYLKCRHEPSLSATIKMCRALGVSLAWLAKRLPEPITRTEVCHDAG